MEALLALAGVAAAFVGKWRLKHAMSSIAAMVALALISMAMIIVVLISAAYTVYLVCLHYGIPPQYSALAVTALMAAATAMSLSATTRSMRKVIKTRSSPDRISETIDAFLDGFMA